MGGLRMEKADVRKMSYERLFYNYVSRLEQLDGEYSKYKKSVEPLEDEIKTIKQEMKDRAQLMREKARLGKAIEREEDLWTIK